MLTFFRVDEKKTIYLEDKVKQLNRIFNAGIETLHFSIAFRKVIVYTLSDHA